MINISKTALFIWMFICVVTGGVSLSFVDWSVLKTGEGIIKEFQTPVLLLILSFVFMLKYIKALNIEKEQNNENSQ